MSLAAPFPLVGAPGLAPFLAVDPTQLQAAAWRLTAAAQTLRTAMPLLAAAWGQAAEALGCVRTGGLLAATRACGLAELSDCGAAVDALAGALAAAARMYREADAGLAAAPAPVPR